MIKISSYNVNGIRAAHRKGFLEWVEESNPDVICIQELRADESQIPKEVVALDYHKHIHIAEKKGYSGVAIFSKQKPKAVFEGMGTEWIDSEGRVLIVEFEKFYVCSVYAPSGTTGDIRQDMKYKFLDDFYAFGKKHLDENKEIVFCGDFNICHEAIDIHNPEKQNNTSGFLPEERKWISDFLALGYQDVYRNLHRDEPDLYSWWSYRAASKQRNKGWRIDYHFATDTLAKKAVSAEIEMKWDISDHAPVSVTYDL